ncbi:hypothetical protein CerSpe_071530 [Prunus speciosa]
MQRQAQQARTQLAQVEGSKHWKKMTIADVRPPFPADTSMTREPATRGPGAWCLRQDRDPREEKTLPKSRRLRPQRSQTRVSSTFTAERTPHFRPTVCHANGLPLTYTAWSLRTGKLWSWPLRTLRQKGSSLPKDPTQPLRPYTKQTVADQTRVAAFYVVQSSVDYNILLARDWIHQSGCIPFSLFQLLFFWDGQKVSIHPADERPFEANAVQARIYNDDVGWVVLTGHDASGRPTRTTAQKVLELGTENVRQDSACEVLIDLTNL